MKIPEITLVRYKSNFFWIKIKAIVKQISLWEFRLPNCASSLQAHSIRLEWTRVFSFLTTQSVFRIKFSSLNVCCQLALKLYHDLKLFNVNKKKRYILMQIKNNSCANKKNMTWQRLKMLCWKTDSFGQLALGRFPQKHSSWAAVGIRLGKYQASWLASVRKTTRKYSSVRIIFINEIMLSFDLYIIW